MQSSITLRLPESKITEIETLVHDTGLWKNKSEFLREAIETHIKKYWIGDRLGY